MLWIRVQCILFRYSILSGLLVYLHPERLVDKSAVHRCADGAASPEGKDSARTKRC